RFVAITNALATLSALLLNFWLIPRHGALGAACATAAALMIQNTINHVGLWRRTDVVFSGWRRWTVYSTILIALAVLFAVCSIFSPPGWIVAILIAMALLILLRVNRSSLQILNTFPELRRVPLMSFLFAAGEKRR
ncbi:MAG: polysaccharide biosynthesis C-terminal domain-containing protein, partial [Planctomycetes bacterium]|nr:polysaccharide biosynthesis C-terminal domain-containing protein [Planctomycetota bacterium]